MRALRSSRSVCAPARGPPLRAADQLGRRRRRLEVRRRRRPWFYGELQGASLTQNRWTLAFDPANPTAIDELPFLERAAPKAQAAGVRILLSLYSMKSSVHDPTAFCAWAQRSRRRSASGASTTTSSGTSRTRGSTGRRRRTRAARTSPAPAVRGAARAVLRRAARGRPARERDRAWASRPARRRVTRTSRSSSCATSARRTAPRGARRRSWISCRCIRIRTRAARPTGRRSAIRIPDRFGVPNLDRVKQAVYDAFNGTGPADDAQRAHVRRSTRSAGRPTRPGCRSTSTPRTSG